MKTKVFYFVLMLFLGIAFTSQALIAQQETDNHKKQSETEKVSREDFQNKEAVGESKGTQEYCPVMGNKINKEIYTDYNGKRIYFCCSGCIDTFKKDPEKYMEKMKEAGVTLKSVPCPVSGKPSSQEIFTEYQGEKIYFCSSACKEKFLKNPEKYMEQEEE
jgi:YHS domain-containing protein